MIDKKKSSQKQFSNVLIDFIEQVVIVLIDIVLVFLKYLFKRKNKSNSTGQRPSLTPIKAQKNKQRRGPKRRVKRAFNKE